MRHALVLLLLAACSDEASSPAAPVEAPAPTTLPAPPFALEAKPPAGWDKWDGSQIPATMLEETADRYAREGKWLNASLVQYQFLQTPGRTHGRYNLACYLSRAGDLDGSIYWLQQAVIEEGVDAAWAAQDPDLIPLHADPRWPALQQHLQDAQRYWAERGAPVTKVFVPQGATGPQPTLVLLHGIASEPGNIYSAMIPGVWANPVAMVSASGTYARGPHTWLWAEDVAKDGARIDAALAEAKSQLVVDPAHTALVGFSQGGLVALDLLSSTPEKYSGVVAFSPGGTTLGQFERTSASLAGKHVVIVVGDAEEAANVQLAERAAKAMERKGADVLLRITPAQKNHSLPLDFSAKFGGWAKFALGGEKPAP